MAKILIVEDDRFLSDMLRTFLAAQNHVVEQVFDGSAGWDYLHHFKFDLIVLDWQLPAKSGVDILESLKQSGKQIPVLMLTSRVQVEDKLHGLDAGADDYLTKPVNLQEFGARVRALLRRSAKAPPKSLSYKDVALQPASGQARRGSRHFALAPKESQLLALLMQQQGEYLSTEALLERLWGTTGTRAGLANCLKRLRGKLTEDGEAELIETVAALGYRLQ